MEAVGRAEEYIVLNGYTDLPGASDISQLTPESLEWDPPDCWLEQRHDSLDRAAYGYSYGRRAGKRGWTIIFRHARGRGSDTGRAIEMDEFGLEARMMHSDYFLSAVEFRLPSW